MEQRVDEDGKSEGPAVMVGIEVEPIGNITSRESGQTSIWSLSTRELGYQAKGAKQMTGETKATAPRTRAAATPGAAPHTPTDWHAIHWRQVERQVRRLQARIVQATQAGRWGKVRALQHLLTHSFSGKALAVRRVTENRGKDTPGVGIPTMADRAMQTLYLLALDPVAEVLSDPNSYGFRVGRSPADAVAQCFIVLGNRFAPQWVLEGDVLACFDRISHDWLFSHVPMDTGMLRKWLKAGYLEKHSLQPTEEGAPQGGPISPALANLTLNGLETLLRERFPQEHQKSQTKVNLVRFADDCAPRRLKEGSM